MIRILKSTPFHLLVLLAIWHGFAWAKATPLFPGPLDVVNAIYLNGAEILSELWRTIYRAFGGFAIATVTMIPFGIAIGRTRALAFVMEPLIVMLATLPPPATVPVVMLFAGTGDLAKIVVIAYAAAIPLVINSSEAARGLHPMFGLVGRSLHLTRLESMRLIALPSSLPMIATAVRMAVSASLLVSITSEMLLSTNGIGNFLQRSQENFQIDAGLAVIAFISVSGLLINRIIQEFEKRMLSWHYQNSLMSKG